MGDFTHVLYFFHDGSEPIFVIHEVPVVLLAELDDLLNPVGEYDSYKVQSQSGEEHLRQSWPKYLRPMLLIVNRQLVQECEHHQDVDRKEELE